MTSFHEQKHIQAQISKTLYIQLGIQSFKITFRLKENEEKAHVLEEEKQQFDEQAQELNETIKV